VSSIAGFDDDPGVRHFHADVFRTPLIERGVAEGRTRELALFNLAIDSKLRACDVVSFRVDDVASQGITVARATIRQKKTGRLVRFELTEPTYEAVDEYLRTRHRRPSGYLFPGRGSEERHLTTRQYARLVARWIASVGTSLGSSSALAF
jgi:integrase